MMAITFDTLLYSKKLQENGFSPEQAEASVEMVKEIIGNQLASRQDITDLKHDIADFKKDVTQRLNAVKNQIKDSENKTVICLGVMIVSGIGVFSILLTILSKIH